MGEVEPYLTEWDNAWMEWNRLIERDHVWRKLNRNSKNGMKGGDMGPLLIAWDCTSVNRVDTKNRENYAADRYIRSHS
ncbi:hypothetical protein, partial [Paenibacillus barengoltzii]|uniref:hypothetical protein n=1 Tax=Paenibacillus barengoltzii TaxID=343517 RepID=UPI00387914EA